MCTAHWQMRRVCSGRGCGWVGWEQHAGRQTDRQTQQTNRVRQTAI